MEQLLSTTWRACIVLERMNLRQCIRQAFPAAAQRKRHHP